MKNTKEPRFNITAPKIQADIEKPDIIKEASHLETLIEIFHAKLLQKLAIANFTLGKIPLIFRHTESEFAHETREFTVEELLAYINEGHSDSWTNYDESDWQEGMNNWTDLAIDWDLTFSTIVVDFE